MRRHRRRGAAGVALSFLRVAPVLRTPRDASAGASELELGRPGTSKVAEPQHGHSQLPRSRQTYHAHGSFEAAERRRRVGEGHRWQHHPRCSAVWFTAAVLQSMGGTSSPGRRLWWWLINADSALECLPISSVPCGTERGDMEMDHLEHFAPNLSGPASRHASFSADLVDDNASGEAAEQEDEDASVGAPDGFIA